MWVTGGILILVGDGGVEPLAAPYLIKATDLQSADRNITRIYASAHESLLSLAQKAQASNHDHRNSCIS
mgnify:CR=1 FL=1